MSIEDELSEYIKAVGSFQYENEPFEIIGVYDNPEYETCQVCGHYPIREIFVISSKTRTFHVGNECIDTITNKKIGDWYKSWRRRKKVFDENKILIELVESIINAYDGDNLQFYDKNNPNIQCKVSISCKAIRVFQKMLNNMRKGRNPSKYQLSYYRSYERRIINAVERSDKI